jgi:bifunctional enzyme Fae/Hps
VVELKNMLDRKQKYLQIALNSSLGEAREIIYQLPSDKRIIIEAGTPLVKEYGANSIRNIRSWWEGKIFGYDLQPSQDFIIHSPLIDLVNKSLTARNGLQTTKTENKEKFFPYIVADLKCMDRGEREVEIAKHAGANALTALGHAPIETLDAFIENCEKHNLDSMIDMMNVEYPLNVLRQLEKPPQVVILHRGVDEEALNREKEIPFHEIQRIKNEYDILIAIAGGDSFQEVQRALFNDADIVVVWKSFYKSTGETAKLAQDFLKEIR